MVHTHAGTLVSALLDDRGISLRQASAITGLSRTTLMRRLDRGDFTVAELGAVADALGTSASSLVAQIEAAA